LAGVGIGLACADAREPRSGEVAVRVDRVLIDDNDSPVVVLEEEGGLRWLPIWIGAAEARSIALQMSQHPIIRPNSHDLARTLIHELEGRVQRVVVTELRDGTYYAVLEVAVGGSVVSLDARPSDAIAIALRDEAPVFVRARLFEQVGRGDESSDPTKSLPERRI
jgi:bifunctional DNase/RNase